MYTYNIYVETICIYVLVHIDIYHRQDITIALLKSVVVRRLYVIYVQVKFVLVLSPWLDVFTSDLCLGEGICPFSIICYVRVRFVCVFHIVFV